MTATPISTIDVRTIVPRERHPLIFSALGNLAKGEALEVVADHAPKHLELQVQARFPKVFAVEYVELGPWVWRLRFVRL